MSVLSNHLFEVCKGVGGSGASSKDATKNEKDDEKTQIAEYEKYLKSTSAASVAAHMRAKIYQSEEKSFSEKEKITSEASCSKNETLDAECIRLRNNNKGKILLVSIIAKFVKGIKIVFQYMKRKYKKYKHMNDHL